MHMYIQIYVLANIHFQSSTQKTTSIHVHMLSCGSFERTYESGDVTM